MLVVFWSVFVYCFPNCLFCGWFYCFVVIVVDGVVFLSKMVFFFFGFF